MTIHEDILFERNYFAACFATFKPGKRMINNKEFKLFL